MKLKSFIVILSLLLFFSSQAQSKKESKEVKVGELPPPPPPPSTPPPGVIVQKMEGAEMPPQEELFDTTPPPADTLTGAIRKMLRLTGASNISKRFADMMAESTGMTPTEKEINQRILAKFKQPAVYNVYENLIVRVYRKHLTLEDINAINAFYESPSGKKYAVLLPSILKASQTEGLNFGHWVYGLVVTEMKDEKVNK